MHGGKVKELRLQICFGDRYRPYFRLFFLLCRCRYCLVCLVGIARDTELRC